MIFILIFITGTGTKMLFLLMKHVNNSFLKYTYIINILIGKNVVILGLSSLIYTYIYIYIYIYVCIWLSSTSEKQAPVGHITYTVSIVWVNYVKDNNILGSKGGTQSWINTFSIIYH